MVFNIFKHNIFFWSYYHQTTVSQDTIIKNDTPYCVRPDFY